MFERTLSFLASICLHLTILIVVLYWPTPEPPPITTGTMVTGLVSFNPLEGKSTAATRQDTPTPQRGVQPTQKTPDKQPDPQTPQVPQTPTQKVPDKQPDPQPTQVAKQPDDTAVPIEKDPEKKPPQQNATIKTPPMKNATAQNTPAKNATTPTPPAKNATTPAKNATRQPKSDSLADALADLDRQTGQQRGSGRTTGAGRGQDLSSALADLGKEAGGSGNGTQGRGAGSPGGTGYGAAGAYADSVVSRVQPNWAWPGRTDRRNYIAVVNIKIAPDGTIETYRLTTPSGNDYFDSTVLRALQATRTLEAPPNPSYMDMDVSFSSDALGK